MLNSSSTATCLEKLKMKELAFLSRSKGNQNCRQVVNHFMVVAPFVGQGEKHEALKDLTIEKERDFDAKHALPRRAKWSD